MKKTPQQITITTNIQAIKSSHLVVFIQDKTDIDQISFVDIGEKQKQQILFNFDNKKDTSDHFFLGEDSFSSLTVLYFFGDNKEALTTFLSKKFSSLGENTTFAIISQKRQEILFDTFVLSTTIFDRYKSKKQDVQQTVFVFDKDTQKKLEERYQTLSNVIFCRELGNTPACDLTPDIFVKKIQETHWNHTKVKVLNSKDIQKKGLGLIHAVGKGSAHAPSFVLLERIVHKKYPTFGLVGKGVVFDTGGLNLKLGDNMFEMKQDMNGAATVFAVMKELDRYKDLKINIVAALPLVENAIGKDAFRPSDIIRSYTGQTVQITNTDAEGRLVLGDAVGYISTNYQLSNIMTIATLTGACLVALGYRYAGIMGNDRQTIDTLVQTNKQDLEKYNELPFDQYFIEKTKSTIADFDNWTGGPKAGATMGAAFIANFLTKNEGYTHIDIAGVSTNSFEPCGYFPTGATGFGVLSLSSFFKSLS